MHGPLALLLLSSLSVYAAAEAAALQSCAELAGTGDDASQRALLCQIAESTQMLAHLGVLVNEGLERVLQANGLTAATEDNEEMAKRKHEYLRFGKRKHEYLRFGKRKHEYLRFGRK